MKNILITGGTGLIGKRLSGMLVERGYQVALLSRSEQRKAAIPAYRWSVEEGYVDSEALLQADAIIHLAGAGIADKRWSSARKREILESRTLGTRLLVSELQRLGKKPQVFVSGSAIGFYGNRGEERLTEASSVGTGFMADVCRDWERELEPLRSWGVRTPTLRIGIVFSTQGGALVKMLPSYRFHLGAYFGNGQQYYAWVHIDDICRMFLSLMENPQADGIFNGTAPQPIRNADLARLLAKVTDKRSLILPAPAFALRLALGEMADVVLHGAQVVPQRLQELGFEFAFPEVETALKDLLQRKI